MGTLDGMKKLPLSTELLEYYRNRLDAADREKQEMIESLKICDVKHSEMHQLQWMLGEREEEVLSLQRVAKEQELQIYSQQEQLLEMRTENHQLRVQEMEDRKRIQQLLSLTKPVTQEVTFMRDVRPSKLTASLSGMQGDGIDRSVEVVCPGSMGAPRHTPGRRPLNPGAATGPSPRGVAQQEASVATRMLRTVYLPSEKTDSMLLTIDALRRELEEYKRVGAEKLSTVMEQRDQALSESKVQTERLLASTRELQERSTTLSALLRNNEKECVQITFLALDGVCGTAHAVYSAARQVPDAAPQHLGSRAAHEGGQRGRRTQLVTGVCMVCQRFV
jgi:coiled-coil domain-containing protein 77